MINTPSKNYIFWRSLTAIAVCVVIASVAVFIWASIKNNTTIQTAAFFPCFLGMLTIIAILWSVFVFSFDYSCLGKLERTLPPTDFVAKYQTLSFGRFGKVSFGWPLVEWRVGKEGLLIKMLMGSAFIPAEAITNISRVAWMYDVLEHGCPDLANPVYLPKNVCEAACKICEIHPLESSEIPSAHKRDAE